MEGFYAILVGIERYLWGLHILGLVFGLGAATVTDVMFLKFLGNFRITPQEQELMALLSKIVWVGVALLVLSGLLLFIPRASEFLASDRFLMKMTAVGVILVNGLFLNFWLQPQAWRISLATPDANQDFSREDLTKRERVRRVAFALGGISFISWYTAFTLAILNMLTLSYLWMFLTFLALVLIAVIAGQFQRLRLEEQAEEEVPDEQLLT